MPRMVTRIQTTAPISPGSSGGALFDRQGALVGITTSSVRDGQNLNFALPVGDALLLLNFSRPQ
jgi:serine protease Do